MAQGIALRAMFLWAIITNMAHDVDRRNPVNPATNEQVTDKLTTDKLTTDKLTTDKLTTDKLAADKIAAAGKRFCLNGGLYLGCGLGKELLQLFVHARQAYLAQFWGITPERVMQLSYIPRYILLAGSFYFALRAWHYIRVMTALSKEANEEGQRRLRELEDEDARAIAWLNAAKK